jgi:hypothetical protein
LARSGPPGKRRDLIAKNNFFECAIYIVVPPLLLVAALKDGYHAGM